MAVNHGPCLLILWKGPRPLKPSARAQDRRLGTEQDQLSCGSTGTPGNCQETETYNVSYMVWACHTPRQPLQNHPSGHLGGWAASWSAEEMLDGQHQKVDIPAHAKTAYKGLLQKRLEEDLCWIVPHVPPATQSVKGLNWTELNCHNPVLGLL